MNTKITQERYTKALEEIKQLNLRTYKSVLYGNEFVKLWIDQKLFSLKIYLKKLFFEVTNVDFHRKMEEEPELFVHRMFYSYIGNGLFVIKPHNPAIVSLEIIPLMFFIDDDVYNNMKANHKKTSKKQREKMANFINEHFQHRMIETIWKLSIIKRKKLNVRAAEFIKQASGECENQDQNDQQDLQQNDEI